MFYVNSQDSWWVGQTGFGLRQQRSVVVGLKVRGWNVWLKVCSQIKVSNCSSSGKWSWIISLKMYNVVKAKKKRKVIIQYVKKSNFTIILKKSWKSHNILHNIFYYSWGQKNNKRSKPRCLKDEYFLTCRKWGVVQFPSGPLGGAVAPPPALCDDTRTVSISGKSDSVLMSPALHIHIIHSTAGGGFFFSVE